METPDEAGRRLTALEIKASFAEDLLEQLDRVIIRQQQQIDLLEREVIELRRRLPDLAAGASPNQRDELPPHY